MSEREHNNTKEPEDWERLEKPEINWDKMQRIVWADLANVDANIRNATLQGNGQMVLAFQGMRAQMIMSLGVCQLNLNAATDPFRGKLVI